MPLTHGRFGRGGHFFPKRSPKGGRAKPSPPPAPYPAPAPDPSSVALAPCPEPASRSLPPSRDSRGTPNKTEADYNATVLHGKGRYEAVTLRLPGGNYTPDWMTIDDGTVTFHEVKGSFRFGSESRAILAFMSAAAAFPFFGFVWAQRQKGGKWVVKHAIPASPPAQPATPAQPSPDATSAQPDPPTQPD